MEFDSTAGDTIRNITWLKTLPVIGGVNEVAVAAAVSVYPNPASSQINFEIKNGEANSIEVFDLYGNKIASLAVNKNNKITFSTQQLASGTYLYRSADATGKMLGRGKFDVIR